MTYTAHGHHIPNTPIDIVRPVRVARCGGIGVCPNCATEAGLVQHDMIRESEIHVDLALKARQIVQEYYNDNADKTDEVFLAFEDTYVVWFCKALQNWKALVSTTVPDGMYYEVTYDGDKGVAYLDAYKKFKNVEVKVR